MEVTETSANFMHVCSVFWFFLSPITLSDPDPTLAYHLFSLSPLPLSHLWGFFFCCCFGFLMLLLLFGNCICLSSVSHSSQLLNLGTYRKPRNFRLLNKNAGGLWIIGDLKLVSRVKDSLEGEQLKLWCLC